MEVLERAPVVLVGVEQPRMYAVNLVSLECGYISGVEIGKSLSFGLANIFALSEAEVISKIRAALWGSTQQFGVYTKEVAQEKVSQAQKLLQKLRNDLTVRFFSE